MAGKKILIIDDSINLCQSLKKRFELEFKDVTVLTCHNGMEGIPLARAEQPDLIFLDINMPGMHGDEVLKDLKYPADLKEGESSTQDIPVIILTAHGPELRAKYIELGAYEYVSSPFETDDLVKKVCAIFG